LRHSATSLTTVDWRPEDPLSSNVLKQHNKNNNNVNNNNYTGAAAEVAANENNYLSLNQAWLNG